MPRLPANNTAIALGVLCCTLFGLPALLVSKGFTIAGDKQKDSTEDILAISPVAVQRETNARRERAITKNGPPS